MKKISKKILNVILPASCISCHKVILDDKTGVCAECWKELDFITKPMCDNCGFPFDFSMEEGTLCAECLTEESKFSKMRCVFKYNDKSKKMILALKYGDRTDTVGVLSDFMIKAGADFIDDIDIVMPVPLHRCRLFRRKYNQSALLAKAISNKTGAEFAADGLVRVKHTKPQGHFTRSVRKNNLKGAFKHNEKHSFKGKRVLLVDDVITTGATVNNCVKVLKKKHKDCDVYVLGLARVLLTS